MRKSNTLRAIWYCMPLKLRYILRRLYYFPIDVFDVLTGNTSRYVPPRGLIYTGSPASAKDYIQQGKNQLEVLRQHIDLQNDAIVLDMGSGVGRTAIALSQFLTAEGAYFGFDIVKQGVDWCNKRLGKDYPNFQFQYVSLSNDLYTSAKAKAIDFRFPYHNEHFDNVFSFSLFTHMPLEEIQHYLNEIHRVIKPNGLAFSTFFLYDDVTESKIESLKNFAFPYKKDGYRLMSENVTSGNIAIHKSVMLSMLHNAHLKCIRIVDGYWNDNNWNSEKKEYQDIVVFKRM